MEVFVFFGKCISGSIKCASESKSGGGGAGCLPLLGLVTSIYQYLVSRFENVVNTLDPYLVGRFGGVVNTLDQYLVGVFLEFVNTLDQYLVGRFGGFVTPVFSWSVW